jgi:hypothetical protein
MKFFPRSAVCRLLGASAVLASVLFDVVAGAALIPAGVSRVDISPEKAVPLMGYAARAKLPATNEVAQRIYARALAIGSDPDAAILLTVDNCILPASVSNEIRARLVAKANLRPERITVAVTHTHSAPCLTDAAPNIFGRDMTHEEQVSIDAYTEFFIGRLEHVAIAALADRNSRGERER